MSFLRLYFTQINKRLIITQRPLCRDFSISDLFKLIWMRIMYNVNLLKNGGKNHVHKFRKKTKIINEYNIIKLAVNI